MKRGLALIATALLALLAVSAAGAKSTKTADTTITGAGSSLVAPLVSQWVQPVGRAFGYTLQYSSVGSGAGIAAITARTVDFGASDAPLTPDQAAACKGCVQIPWALSATTLSYNIPGTPNDLHLTGPVIAGIYLGQITNWNDPQIKSLNPKVTLPDLKITPVFRSDGSGDTYAFTDYLSRVSPTWKSKVGNATSVQFPTGIGGKGNPGVAGVIANTKGAIGYISAAYTLSNHLRVAAVKNANGFFATPGLRGIAAAAATVKSVPSNNEMHIVNPPKGAKLAYPISTFTYVIVPQTSPHAQELRKFIFWALTQGQAKSFTSALIFAQLPKVVLVAAEKTLKSISA
ncbi:MAG TPA: phosphate ABC transporter substrate-binding protein PstS [Polyangiaceae bacterium]|jgi:phosphate transport system substrate-binding protein|nr:phosphate ABC transporter substrate-binding protein PstS [Polyangiaceae bacterium]